MPRIDCESVRGDEKPFFNTEGTEGAEKGGGLVYRGAKRFRRMGLMAAVHMA